MSNKAFNIFFLLLISTLINIHVSAQSADIILINGKIFTSDTAHLYVQALAIKGNKIIAAGSDAAIEKTASAKTKKIDLEGKTVIPGFNDAHDHPGWAAPIGKSFTSQFSVPGLGKKAVIDSVARLAKQAKPNEWISGLIGTTVFNDTTIRDLLDSLTPNNPVQLQNMWGHGIVLNSYALKMLGITNDEPDPLGGWYVRKSGSNLITGALYEYAQWPVWLAISAAEPDHLIEGLRLYSNEQVKMGITTVQFMNFDFPTSAPY
ncbi:MAG: amidohydrolase family protein, partial [Aquabacterium sp.]|nr:amidohydrolase family protein [Ferruginibacter sp.]